MAEISNPQLTSFCNEQLRPLADALARIDAALPGIVALYNSRNLGTVISDAGSSNLIDDGSATDGRTRRSGGDVWNMVTLLQDLQTFLTQDRRNVLIGWQVNGVPKP